MGGGAVRVDAMCATEPPIVDAGEAGEVGREGRRAVEALGP